MRLGARAKLVSLLAVLAVGGATSMFSAASFSSSSDNTTSAAAGAISVTNSKAGTAVISAAGMGPGDVRSGTLSLTNLGDIGSQAELKVTGLNDTPSSPALSSTLDLLVEDITGAASTIWSGKLGSFNSVGAGTIAAGGSRSYRLTLTWPGADKDDRLQAASSSFTFRWLVRS